MAKARRGPTLIQRSRSASSEEKAVYHNITGAGKRGVIRRFFDLTTEDQKAILVKLEDAIERRIRKV